MFCPKCGQQNPDTGKFCRSCGTDLGNLSSALASPVGRPTTLMSRKGRPVSLEGAITKMFTGLAFLIVACILGYTGMAGGRVWWFWMLIPAFGSLGSGVAQYMQIRRLEKGQPVYGSVEAAPALPSSDAKVLSSPQAQFVAAESRYKTGDLIPPSVTDNTTRHLEMDTEGKTMTLPKE